jgi:hypothetical protein
MIVGLLGFIGSGKGTVSEILVNKYNFRQDSFAASLKDMCANIFDWPRAMLEGDTVESRLWRDEVDDWWSENLGIENFTPRYALQYIGTDVFRKHFNPDIWFLTLQNRYRKTLTQNVVISDVRFKNEIKFIQNNNGILVRIRRGDEPRWYDTALRANNGDILARYDLEAQQIHESEWAWVGTNYDYEVENNNTLQDLETSIDTLTQLWSK